MLTVSLHGISIHASSGMYAEEHSVGNRFEVDIDVWLDARWEDPWPFVDYTKLNAIVQVVFDEKHPKLEEYVQTIYERIREEVFVATKARVAVRKYHPPMSGEVKYAQVVFEH
jgi:dihydroneopterin aldolase